MCGCLFFRTDGAAQQPYFLEETLPSSIAEVRHVSGIAADKNNCIWFTTQTGVYRYDGSRFRHYSVVNTPVLQFERMAGVATFSGKNGSRWAIGDSKGYLYEVDNSSQLQSFSLRKEQNEQIAYHRFGIPSLAVPDKNKINDSLRKNTFEIYTCQGRIFLVQENGDILSMDYNDFLKGGKGSLLCPLKKGTGDKIATTDEHFYLITTGGMLRWKNGLADPETVSLSGDIIAKNRPVNFQNLEVLKNAESNILLFWYEGSIYEAEEIKGENSLRTRLLINEAGKDRPNCVFYSPVQQLFIAYFLERGLVFYRPRQFSLLSWNLSSTLPDPADYYYSLLPENNGFITVNDKGLLWLGVSGEKKMLANVSCWKYFLSKDRDGNTWYQQNKGETICYLEAGTTRSIPVINAGHNNGLIGIYQSDDSLYYLLTNHYLKRFILKNGVVRSAQVIYNALPKIEFNFMYNLDPDLVWIGTDRGLIQFNRSDNSTKNITALDNTYVRAVSRLGENNYLVGTYDKGIYQYKNDHWIHLSSTERKMPASAHGFITDKLTSSVWVSSNEGILRFSLRELLNNNTPGNNISFAHLTNFGSGIPAEFNGSSNISGAMLSDSCIAFANAKGIVAFNPLRLVNYPLPVTVLAEPVDKPGAAAANASPYQIEFNPVVPYFGNRQDLDVSYRLTNSDDHWHKLSSNSVISYNNVAPGNHDLEFRIRNSNDKNGKEVLLTAKSFTVPYRWYQKPWFRVLAALIILLVVVLLHNIRIWYLRKRKRELEQLVKLKTSELQETNENLMVAINDLSESEASLKQSNFLKDEYYAVLTHDLRSPLKFLSFNISQLLELLPDLTNEALKKGLFAAYQCSNDVYKLIDEFVYWIQDNEKQLQVRALPAVIDAVITDIKKLYGYNLESNGNTLKTAVEPGLRFITDPKMLFIVLRNAVDNANKYTVKGTITVSATRQNGNLQVMITDTGRGMNPELVQELTDLQYKKEQLNYKQRRSLGFYIMAVLTKKLGGSYTITSTKEKGTDLCFILPELKEENRNTDADPGNNSAPG